ncbi:MAG: HAD-IC family P-type ATPase, partial [Marinilabiliaceae bacterium]|nr:HAD-IC family P-type ATPase [Marinilabiliaceae bacterium]
MTTTTQEWHCLPPEEVCKQLACEASTGLTEQEVQERQAAYGKNIIAPGKRKSALIRLLLQFHNPLIYILLFSASVALLMGSVVDSSIIYGVVLINAIIGFIQEDKAEKAISSLSGSLVTNATVIRNGETLVVDARELVPGDMVLLASGAKVPADMRLIKSRDLQTVEGVLTGESAPVEKQADQIKEKQTGLADRTNMVYASTLVTYGQATGIVVATGDQTEVGKISQMLNQAESLETPLTIKFQEFSKAITYVIIGFAVLAIAIGYFREGTLSQQSLLQSIALAVGAIPEGLPAAITITLAIGVSRMALRRVIIRKLPAVETLGSTTVICSDKTGTLTKNQMTVKHIYTGGVMYDVDGTGYAPQGDFKRGNETVTPNDIVPLNECLVAGLLCNDSQLVNADGVYDIQGDPTEGALIVSAHKAGMTYAKQAAVMPRLDAIPFESQHQYMASLHQSEKERIIYIKGSIEALLQRSNHMLTSTGEEVAIDKQAIIDAAASLSRKGIRVLTIARKKMDSDTSRLDHHHLETGLCIIGLQGMIDPPRPEVIESVAYCKGAGIDVKMITGDHVLTAVAIGQQIGLLDATLPEGVMTHLSGKELEEMDDATLMQNLPTLKVFARVTPEQKLRLVKLLQSQRHIVAMTGDGVNDSPALKQANIGVAMGITGTDVSKEAADIVLTDDNFASIYAAVEEGRAVYDNLIKII